LKNLSTSDCQKRLQMPEPSLLKRLRKLKIIKNCFKLNDMRLFPFKTNRVFALPVNILKPSWNRAKNLERFRKSEFQMFGNFKSFDEERFSPSNSYYANANS
jgi:hypothetical protein